MKSFVDEKKRHNIMSCSLALAVSLESQLKVKILNPVSFPMINEYLDMILNLSNQLKKCVIQG